MTSSQTTTGPYETIIKVNPFNKVSVPMGKNVILKGSANPAEYQVRFSCETNMSRYLSAYVHGMALRLVSAKNCDITIHAYEYQSIEVGSVTSLVNADALNGTQLSIVTGDSARITLNHVLYDGVDIIMFNGGSVAISGATRILDVTQIGSGSIDARALDAVFGRVFASNSGWLQIKSNNYLSMFISGRANIVWCAPEIDIQTAGIDWSAPPNVTQNCS
jgi:hypothetical protein